MAIPLEFTFDILKRREGTISISKIDGKFSIDFQRNLPPVPDNAWARPSQLADAECLLTRCVEFLTPWTACEKRPKGQVLKLNAERHLAKSIPHRTFNAAFRKVFNLPRGRPRKARVR